MKHLMWSYGVDAVVVPNGISRRLLATVDEADVASVRRGLGRGPVLLKVAGWDPNKHWRLAMDIVAHLKSADLPVRLVARGSAEAHGGEVLDHARRLGLRVQDVTLRTEEPERLGMSFAQAGSADVLNITTPMSQDVLHVLYRAADGVLANSEREPSGLVGLETMAAGGTAFTGNTGEEYAHHMDNAVVLDSADPSEAAWHLQYLSEHPEVQWPLRARARQTATRFSWDRVLAQLFARVSVLAANRHGGSLGIRQPLAAGAANQ
jgi:glycosyltransferase involved in cell wall biosynthesis